MAAGHPQDVAPTGLCVGGYGSFLRRYRPMGLFIKIKNQKSNAVGAPLVGAPAMMGHPQRAAYRGETLHATSVQCFGNKIKCRRHVEMLHATSPIGMGLPWWLSFCVSRLEGPKGCEARSEANPGRWRPCEAGARPNNY
jgi:hypothetical protein